MGLKHLDLNREKGNFKHMKWKGIVLICLTLIFLLGTIQYNQNNQNATINKVDDNLFSITTIEKYKAYNVSSANIIIGTQTGSYANTFLLDASYHTITEINTGSGYEFEIRYNISLSFSNKNIIGFKIDIYYRFALGTASPVDNVAICLFNHTSKLKYLLSLEATPTSLHWKNITFYPTRSSDFIEKINNRVCLYLNDTTEVDFNSGTVDIDYIRFTAISSENVIPTFLSSPLNSNYEQYFQKNVSWIVNEENPEKYQIYRNNTLVQSGTYLNNTIILCNLNTSVAGWWRYNIFVNDTYKNNNSHSFLLRVDPKMNPSFLSFPLDKECAESSVDYLIWRINEKYPDKYVIYLNNTAIKSNTYINNTDISCQINTSSLSLLKYRIVINDTSNNIAEHNVSIQIVQQPVPVFVTYPSNFNVEQYFSPVIVNWIIQEDNPDKYELRRNGSLLQSNAYSSGVEIIHTLNTSTDGLWNYSFFVNDTYGNSNSKSFFVTIDPKKNPELISSPNSYEKWERNSVHSLVWKINEKYPDKYLIYRNATLVKSGSYMNATDIFIQANTTTLGIYQYRLFVNDTSNNFMEHLVMVSIEESIIPLFISFPSNASYEQYFSINISWRISEENPRWYEIYRNNSLVQRGLYLNDSLISCKLNTTIIGVWKYTIFVNDSFNNNNSNTFFITIDQKRDPEVIQYPEDTLEYEIGSINYLVWQINEKYPDTYIIYRDSKIIKNGIYFNATDISILVNTSNYGSFQYRIFVNDTSNNFAEDLLTVNIAEYIIPSFSSSPSRSLNYEQYFQINVSWTIREDHPNQFEIYRNGSSVQKGAYQDNKAIFCLLNTTIAGIWNYSISVNDIYNNNNSISFILMVDLKKNPEFLSFPNSYEEYTTNSSNYLIWSVNEKYPNKYCIYLDGILIKSGYYLNNTDISILVNTSVKGTFIYSLIVNDTSNNVSGYSVTVTVSEENKIDWFLLVSLIIGAVAIGVFSMFVYSKTKKRMVNKQEKIFQEKMADYRYFVDLNHIHQIILIYKSSGLVLSSHVLREGHNLDDDLTGGFLTAISNFGEEMKGGSLKTLEFEGFKTLIISTGNIRVAIFFSEEPADILKDKLVEFVNHYESVNHEDIINYNGNRLPFKGFGTVFEDFFNMEILQKHELVIPLKISNLPSLQKRIIGVCSVHGKPQRMEVFMTLCIEKIKRPAFELYQEILVLKKMGIFVLKCE